MVKPNLAFFLTQTKPQLSLNLRGFREADGHHLCWSTHLVTQEQEHRRISQAREQRGRGESREGCSGPPEKGMRPLWGSVQLLFSLWIVSSCSCWCFVQSENSTGLVGPAGLWILVTALTASSSRQGGKRGKVLRK